MSDKINTNKEYGIDKKDVFIDCLVLTASAQQAEVQETLKAVRRVHDELGVKTLLGVSNISFGLPNRELINHIFLTMALTNGLDLAIINPNIESMTGAIRAYKLLANIDENSMGFIKAYSNMPKIAKMQPLSSRTGNVETRYDNVGNDVKNHEDVREYGDLFYAVENGLKNEGAQITEELLKTKDSMEIVNGILIPALDKIGLEFEKGIIFLFFGFLHVCIFDL